MVECVRLPSGRGGWNIGESRGGADLLVRAAERQECLDANLLLRVHQLRIQLVFRNRVFPLLRCDGFRGLGSGDFRAAPALALEGAAGRAGVGFLLCRCSVGWGRDSALSGRTARAAETLTKVDYPALFLSHLVGKHSGPSESIRNTTAVAVGTTCDRRWSKRVAVVAILHSARNRAQERARTT